MSSDRPSALFYLLCPSEQLKGSRREEPLGRLGRFMNITDMSIYLNHNLTQPARDGCTRVSTSQRIPPLSVKSRLLEASFLQTLRRETKQPHLRIIFTTTIFHPLETPYAVHAAAPEPHSFDRNATHFLMQPSSILANNGCKPHRGSRTSQTAAAHRNPPKNLKSCICPHMQSPGKQSRFPDNGDTNHFDFRYLLGCSHQCISEGDALGLDCISK
jgi:hypothetical protein